MINNISMTLLNKHKRYSLYDIISNVNFAFSNGVIVN